MFGKKKYYIVTSDTEEIGLRMYYVGRMSKDEANKYMEELTKKFPVLWLMVTGRGLMEVARNKVQVKDLLGAGRGPSQPVQPTMLDVTSLKGGNLAN